MSGSTEQLGKKIAGAKDLGGVVRAMKALAASSIGQYERAVEALDDYLRTIELGLIACLHDDRHQPPSADLKQRHEPQIGAVIFGSDQGLVGSFNEVIVECSLQSLRALPGKISHVWVIGERARTLLACSALGTVRGLEAPGSLGAITPLIGQILLEVQAAREHGEIWEVHVFHNHPNPSSAYEPVGRRLLPLDAAWQKNLRATPWPTKLSPQVVDGVPSALPAFIQDYLFVLLFQACAESLASENASRLASMQLAEKSIDEMLGDLNRKYHRLRQEGTDEELFDVIAGFEALSPKRTRTSPGVAAASRKTPTPSA